MEHYLALITGAAHRLGQAIAIKLAQQGYAIGIHYHRSESSALATQEAIQKMGVPAFLFHADLSNESQIQTMFTEIARLPHPLRVLVNSAAIMSNGDLKNLTSQEWDMTLAINLRAPFLCAQQAARLMEPDGGIIINITDSGSKKVWTKYPVYCISKAGLEGLTNLLAKTLAPSIRVNAVAPGLILRSDDMPTEEWQKLVDRLPLKHSGNPNAVANTVWFLIENDYITGQTLAVDGGYQLV